MDNGISARKWELDMADTLERGKPEELAELDKIEKGFTRGEDEKRQPERLAAFIRWSGK